MLLVAHHIFFVLDCSTGHYARCTDSVTYTCSSVKKVSTPLFKLHFRYAPRFYFHSVDLMVLIQIYNKAFELIFGSITLWLGSTEDVRFRDYTSEVVYTGTDLTLGNDSKRQNSRFLNQKEFNLGTASHNTVEKTVISQPCQKFFADMTPYLSFQEKNIDVCVTVECWTDI